jgi:hypothetical protein
MTTNKYTKKRVKNNVREVFNSVTNSWETYTSARWNDALWIGIAVDETIHKRDNSTSDYSSSSSSSSYSSSSSSSSYDSGSCSSSSCD